jgi:hypothetical protein
MPFPLTRKVRLRCPSSKDNEAECLARIEQLLTEARFKKASLRPADHQLRREPGFRLDTCSTSYDRSSSASTPLDLRAEPLSEIKEIVFTNGLKLRSVERDDPIPEAAWHARSRREPAHGRRARHHARRQFRVPQFEISDQFRVSMFQTKIRRPGTTRPFACYRSGKVAHVFHIPSL